MSDFSNSGEGSCLLCSNPNLHVPVNTYYVSKVTSEVIPSCITYLPTELTAALNGLSSTAIKSPIFCKLCFENCWILSKLNTQLEDIKNKISQHVSSITTIIKSSRTKMADNLPISFLAKPATSHFSIQDDEVILISPDSSDTEEVEQLEAYSRYPCKDCSKTFSCSQSLDEHIQKDHKEPWKPRAYKSKLGSKRKNIYSTPNDCTKCGKVFKKVSELIIHDVDVHSAFSKKQFQCDNCQKWFSTSEKLERHQINTHRNECTVCGKVFEFLVNLEHHYATHVIQPKIVSVVSYSNNEEMKESSSFEPLSNVIKAASDEATTQNFDTEEYILGTTNSCWQQDENIMQVKTCEKQRPEIDCEIIDLVRPTLMSAEQSSW